MSHFSLNGYNANLIIDGLELLLKQTVDQSRKINIEHLIIEIKNEVGMS